MLSGVREASSASISLSQLQQHEVISDEVGEKLAAPQFESLREFVEGSDSSFLFELRRAKDITAMSDDERLMQVMGITHEQLIERRERQDNALTRVLYPDGVTAQEKNEFNANTGEFLNYMFDWYALKQVCVPGTEVPDIFRDAGNLKNVQRYLAKLSESVSSKLLENAHPAAVTEAELQESARKGGSASSCAAEAMANGSLYKVLLDKIAGSDRANLAKGEMYDFFLQKINFLGLFDSFVKLQTEKLREGDPENAPPCKMSRAELHVFREEIASLELGGEVNMKNLDAALSNILFFKSYS